MYNQVELAKFRLIRGQWTHYDVMRYFIVNGFNNAASQQSMISWKNMILLNGSQNSINPKINFFIYKYVS